MMTMRLGRLWSVPARGPGARRRATMQAGAKVCDVTLRLRSAGWKTLLAPDAICYTDVPATLMAVTRQRFRWERDAIRLRNRKHRDLLNPFSSRFKVVELLHELDFLIFNILAAIVFPFYLVWLFVTYGEFALIILMARRPECGGSTSQLPVGSLDDAEGKRFAARPVPACVQPVLFISHAVH